MDNKIYLDIETYCDLDLKRSGVYKYSEHSTFEIMLLAYAFNTDEVKVIDLANGEKIPSDLAAALLNPAIVKVAHNANFERVCLRQIGYEIPINQWECTAAKAAYFGFPRALSNLSVCLNLGDKGKLETGHDLIKLFCIPDKNGNRMTAVQKPDEWDDFKEYIHFDVIAAREISTKLDSRYHYPSFEKSNYELDQKINDRGVLIDLSFVAKAVSARDELIHTKEKHMLDLGVNLRSGKQVKEALLDKGIKTDNLRKDTVSKIKNETDNLEVKELLESKEIVCKTSLKKFDAMINVTSDLDNHARGLFQYYGAGTGRWAGRLIQLQNLPRNSKTGADLLNARNSVLDGTLLKGGINHHETLSDLIRTCLIPNKGKLFAVADFSAIEARVLSWLAGEEWRLEVFRTHGKIYEASAARMFGVPIESVTKGSDYRQKGKIAELALGYQGGVNALAAMDGGKMDDKTRKMILWQWREANPKIVRSWHEIEDSIHEYRRGKPAIECFDGKLKIRRVMNALEILLPSTRALYYRFLVAGTREFEEYAQTIRFIRYVTPRDKEEITYGGKLIENVVQAIARDLLADSMQRLDAAGFDIVAHIHDEIICEVDESEGKEKLEEMCKIMGAKTDWAPELPLKADGYLCNFYQKD